MGVKVTAGWDVSTFAIKQINAKFCRSKTIINIIINSFLVHKFVRDQEFFEIIYTLNVPIPDRNVTTLKGMYYTNCIAACTHF